jgi:hypothetical protein
MTRLPAISTGTEDSASKSEQNTKQARGLLHANRPSLLAAKAP